jgi:uncharacterized protein involved in type VI secretion and phage assembly
LPVRPNLLRIHLPRIGQEVLVNFIGGYPDLPICTGRAHNELNLPPWELHNKATVFAVKRFSDTRRRYFSTWHS